MSLAFEGCWTTGVNEGKRQDETSLGKSGNGRVSPMFAFSSAPNVDFAVHYGSDPLLGFHFPKAFESNESGRYLVLWQL